MFIKLKIWPITIFFKRFDVEKFMKKRIFPVMINLGIKNHFINIFTII